MKKVCFLVILLLGITATVEGGCSGQIQVRGVDGPTYIMTGNPPAVGVSGGRLSLKYNNGAFYTTKCQNNWDPTVFRRWYVLDKTLTFTADVSSISCGCNAALYFVLMPAYGANQQPSAGNCGDYYCDANNVCGQWCPEIDLMEANTAAFQITPHSCSPPQGNHYTKCDGSGCGVNSHRYNANAYGYGGQFTINTQQPFNVSYHFQTANGQLSQITSTFRQGGKSFSVNHNSGNCGGDYLPSLTNAFKQGLVLTSSYWGNSGGTMSWLDVPPCSPSTSCNTGGTAYFSDIVIS